MSLNYWVNEASTIHEVIDGEAIMINLESGNYYTLNDSGALIWNLIQQKCLTQDIVKAVAAYYALAVSDAGNDTEAFLQHAAREGLVLEAGAGAVPSASLPTEPAKPYAAPQLTVFKDMQDLLLLDPIHEIGDQGWPHTAPKNKKTA